MKNYIEGILRIAVVVLFLTSGGMTMAQDASSAATAAEKTELEKQVEIATQKQALAEARKAEAEAKKAERELDVPSSTTKGAAGTVTVGEGAGYFSEILAYRAMQETTEIIAKLVAVKMIGDTIIIMGEQDLAKESAQWNLLTTKINDARNVLSQTISQFPNDGQDHLDSLGDNESLLAVLGAAPAVLGAAADVASFFHTTRSISNRDVEIQTEALTAAITAAIKAEKNNAKIILPGKRLSAKGDVFNGVNELITLRNRVVAIKNTLNEGYAQKIALTAEQLIRLRTKKSVLVKVIDKAIADESDLGKLTALEDRLVNLEFSIDNASSLERGQVKVLTPLDQLITATNDLISAITTGSGEKPSPLESVANMEQLNQHSDANLLYLTVVSQGGEIETSKTAFTQGRVSYLGGTIVSYMLTKNDGEYLTSGNVEDTNTATFKRKNGSINLAKL